MVKSGEAWMGGRIGRWMNSWMRESNRKRSRNESRPLDEQGLTYVIKEEIPETTFTEENHKHVGSNGPSGLATMLLSLFLNRIPRGLGSRPGLEHWITGSALYHLSSCH